MVYKRVGKRRVNKRRYGPKTKKVYRKPKVIRPRYKKKSGVKLTYGTLKHFVPDIMKTKLKNSFTIRNYRMTDLDVAQVMTIGSANDATYDPTVTNAIYICLNANPVEGRLALKGRSLGQYVSGSVAPLYNTSYPGDMLINGYSAYRPMGCKVRITILPADSPEIGATGTNGPTQIFGTPTAPPTCCALLPFQRAGNNKGNYWNSLNAPVALSADTIGETKYGSKHVYSGSGGKSQLTYTKYYDVAKIYGCTRDQVLADNQFSCEANVTGGILTSKNPVYEAWLMINIAEFCADNNQTRYCNVMIDMVQYGRWEGPKILTD